MITGEHSGAGDGEELRNRGALMRERAKVQTRLTKKDTDGSFNPMELRRRLVGVRHSKAGSHDPPLYVGLMPCRSFHLVRFSCREAFAPLRAPRWKGKKLGAVKNEWMDE